MAMMDTSYSLICRPSLSTIHLPIYDMGALAVRLLTKILNQEESRNKRSVRRLYKYLSTLIDYSINHAKWFIFIFTLTLNMKFNMMYLQQMKETT